MSNDRTENFDRARWLHEKSVKRFRKVRDEVYERLEHAQTNEERAAIIAEAVPREREGIAESREAIELLRGVLGEPEERRRAGEATASR